MSASNGSDKTLPVCSRVLLLVGGDAAFLLLFAVIGRINHGELLDSETLATVVPFWLGTHQDRDFHDIPGGISASEACFNTKLNVFFVYLDP